jgi:hypothetical protein
LLDSNVKLYFNFRSEQRIRKYRELVRYRLVAHNYMVNGQPTAIETWLPQGLLTGYFCLTNKNAIGASAHWSRYFLYTAQDK